MQEQVIAVSQDIGKHFLEVRKEFVKNFGLQSWMGCDCPSCKNHIAIEEALEIGISFSPQFLGDLAISYVCPSCCTAFVWHIKCNVKNISDILWKIGTTKSQDSVKPGYECEYQHVLIENHRHNISEAEAKAAEATS